jgi:hypothetical protein
MLQVELDIFSGMPNPVWRLSSRQEAMLYERLDAEPRQMSPVRTAAETFGLGYRGLIVRRIKSDNGPWDKAISTRRNPFPNDFRLGSKKVKGESAADWLLTTANSQGARIVDQVQEAVSRGVLMVPKPRAPRRSQCQDRP